MTETERPAEKSLRTPLNRRRFLRNAGLIACAATVPFTLSITPDTLIHFFDRGQVQPGNEFSLLKLENLLPEYSIPRWDAFSIDAYTAKYVLYNLYQNFFKRAGSFIFHKRHNGENSIFNIQYDRAATAGLSVTRENYSYIIKGTIVCENNLFTTPMTWDLESKIARSSSSSPYSGTGFAWIGKNDAGNIRSTSKGNTDRKTVPHDNLTWKWGIIDLIQKMAKNSISSTEFSTLDEMDVVYNYQSVRLRKMQNIDCGNKIIRFKVFDLVGDGIIPTVYWVDEHNRVIFIISGMEAWLLENQG